MEFIFELILELFFEGAEEIAGNKKKPKPLRIIAGSFIALFIAAVVALIGILAIIVIRKHILVGIVLLAFDAVMIGFGVKKFIELKNKR